MIPGIGAVHPSLQPRVRFVIALAAIAANLTFGLVDAFNDGLKQGGYTNPADFWEDLLSEPMKAADFIHDMTSFHFNPAMHGVDLIRMTLRGLLEQAAQTEESFILTNGMVEPRGAVRWLLSKPQRRALIPVELAQHIGGAPSDAPAVASNAGKSSPPRLKRPATQVPDVVRALLELYPSGPPTANRGVMLKAVGQHIGRPISLATLDRARKKAWQT
jgi:hypothetical protein